ncbi:hypothetical protein NFI96_002970 [Prochilodus magdalenae]|nr:hypothetical protein NFI96_002970 [Prochilodus magdalenae]
MKLRSVCVSLLVFALLAGQHGGSRVRLARLDRWVKAALQYVKLSLCRRVSLPEGECSRLAHLRLSGVVVYVSESSPDKVLAILPDSQSTVSPGAEEPGANRELFPGASAHDAVLVLDPSPEESFGHPVVLFYVDFNVTKKRCGHMDGVYLGEECLTLALKTRCQNQLKRRRSRSDRMVGRPRFRRSTVSRAGRVERSGGLCEIHFLPLVVGVKDSNRTQRLSCVGGWQEQITYQRHVQNLLLFYRMLRNNGFHKDHIKTFFAGNGQVAAKDAEGMYPATEKEVIRNHISYICRKQHCADSLVLYLNSPTRNDGTMLLWDRNNNGIADLKERYTVGELLADLAGCRASRVLLFVEQSYSSVLSKRLKSSLKHLNVVLLNGLPWVDTAQFWASLRPSHCLIDHLSKSAVMPRVGDGAASLLNVTLAGAPCNSTPPLTEAEMRKEYMGCQNLPTALWHQGRRKPEDSERN